MLDHPTATRTDLQRNEPLQVKMLECPVEGQSVKVLKKNCSKHGGAKPAAAVAAAEASADAAAKKARRESQQESRAALASKIFGAGKLEAAEEEAE